MSSFFTHIFLIVFIALAFLTVSCSAQTEEQALDSLRQMVAGGIEPTEDYLASIERRFGGKRAAALAKLLHAKIKVDKSDFAGAALLLDSDEFAQKTTVADHALFLRGKALAASGQHAEAIKAFERLTREYPYSISAREARLLWADSATAAGQTGVVAGLLNELNDQKNAAALFRTAKAYEAQGDQTRAIQFYRRTYFFGAGSDEAKQAEAKLTALAQPLTPVNPEEALARANGFYAAKNFAEAEKAYASMISSFGSASTPETNLRRIVVYSNLRRPADAQASFNLIPASAKEKEEGYYQLAMAFGRARQWPQVRQTVEEMRQKFPNGRWTPKAWIDAGLAARDAKNKLEEQYLLRAAVSNFPNAIEVAGAQFELAWMEHDGGNFARSSQLLVEHLARYAQKDTSYRGRAGYWAARDSERAGKTADACALYEGVIYRYSANWYGYLAQQRLTNPKTQGKCVANAPVSALVSQAVASMRAVTVAPETATDRERIRIDKARDLADVTLFDLAAAELEEGQKTARNSPSINLALARVNRLKGDNVNAFLALAKSYPDYSQMFPEEMGREEWDIFYPLTNWKDIKYWASKRTLDPFQVAGLIRQESVFNPRARSGANAYGLMQLIIPTAQSTARKYGSSSAGSISVSTLYNPAINIELGTAYLRDQLDKFGRIEYVAAAYNAGPNRIPGWRATLPIEIDEFVEAIPFRETKAYVQGVIRNTAQYRRLYDEAGNFKSNVGTRPVRGEIDSLSKEQLAAEFPDLVVETDFGGE